MDIFDNVQEQVYTVAEVTQKIKQTLEKMPPVLVKGEISNFTHHSSGHMYFSLKDKDATIRCVFFKWQNKHLRFRPESGMSIVADGEIKVYEPSGQYQLVLKTMHPVGVGDLEVAFQQLKKKLSEEGLFEVEHKQQIPSFPNRIGVVTSATGAAIRDIINVITRRNPTVEIILNPAKVQGEGGAEEITKAIDEFNEYGDVDVLIVGRGGGSLEDLWCFNEEIVARAIFRSKIPVISAVGHEIDYTISDFVADLRAPTPSAAAELAVADRAELLIGLKNLEIQITKIITNQMETLRNKLDILKNSYGFRRPVDFVEQRIQRLDELQRAMNLAFNGQFEKKQEKLGYLVSLLESLSPLSVLKRGYGIVRKLPHNEVVRSIHQLEKDDFVEIQLTDGYINGQIKEKIDR